VKIHGTGGIAKGSIEEGFTCDMWDFDTDNDTRNKHMREKYLEVEKFPKAKLVLDRTVKPSEAFDWSGQLTIKKETKPVKGKATIKDGVLTATFTISLADYPSIGVPSWLGVTVAKNVEVTVKGPEK
jgi:polyisoprenoid-binding protein YceI